VHLARALTAYLVVWIQRQVRTRPVPFSWAHVFYWGGLRGSIPLALVVGLPKDFPLREEFLVASFAVVLVSLVVQGLTITPLLRRLGLAQGRGA
jgi:monovalent cation:H+ antiporter, CPA1 family